MLSKIMRRGLPLMQRSAMMVPSINFQKRGFEQHLNLDSTKGLEVAEFKEKDQVALWKDHMSKDTSLATRDNE